MQGEGEKKGHAVVVPYPLQGHVIPAVHLAIKLATEGLTVTFVNTEAVHRRTSTARHTAGGGSGDDDDIFDGVRRAAGLDIRYELVSDGLPADFDRSSNHDQFMLTLLHVSSAHVESLLRRISCRHPPPTCLIADTFFVWPAALSSKFGLLHASFWTEPALVFSLYYHLDLLRYHGHFASPENNREDAIDYIPGVGAMDPGDLMSYLQEKDTSSVVHQIIFRAFEGAKAADLVLCNTAEELEPATVAALRREKPFYTVGPLFPAGFPTSPVKTSMWPEANCAQWLATRPRGTVLYVSFGSYAQLRRGDLEEIAMGVLQSGVSFLWALRPGIAGAGEGEPLPLALLEGGGGGRGLVVPWCNQAAVLSNDAVGGFLSHCGWNSVLESIWCGVPLLCFPLLTDQFTNRKLVVDEWRIGLEVSGRGSAARREEVARKIGLLMGGGAARDSLDAAMKEARGALASAGGSSRRNLDQFILDLKAR